MQALALARQRLRARIQSPSTPRPVRLAHGMVENGRSRYLPILSSALAQELLSHGYDARTLERVYANRPAGGPLGRLADRLILELPVHRGLRERLEAAAGEAAAAAVLALRGGVPEFRILSAPCGLGAEIFAVAERLGRLHPDLLPRVRFWGVDPDPEGVLLPEARRRARRLAVAARFLREDLRRRREVAAVAGREGPFHLVSCLGPSSALDGEGLAELYRFYAGILAPGGTLLVDRWEPAERSRVAEGLGISLARHSAAEFQERLRYLGLAVEREHPTGEGGCVLTVARRKPRS